MKKIFLILLFLPLTLFANDFQQGNIEFTNKNYAEAIDHYLNDMDEFGYSLETLYNLSNVYQKQNSPGQALYYLYKAKILNPLEKSIQRDIKDIEESFEIENSYSYLIPIPLTLLNLLLPISLLLLSISISLFLYVKQNRVKKVIKYTIYISIFCIIFTYSMKLYTTSKLEDGIILEDSKVQLSPYENSDVTFNISETSIINISDDFEDYYYITDNNDRYGWIKKSMVGVIWK